MYNAYVWHCVIVLYVWHCVIVLYVWHCVIVLYVWHCVIVLYVCMTLCCVFGIIILASNYLTILFMYTSHVDYVAMDIIIIIIIMYLVTVFIS